MRVALCAFSRYTVGADTCAGTCSASTGSPSLRSIWMHSAASSLRSNMRFFSVAVSSFAHAAASTATFLKAPCGYEGS